MYYGLREIVINYYVLVPEFILYPLCILVPFCRPLYKERSGVMENIIAN
jgi:hypothetical protein